MKTTRISKLTNLSSNLNFLHVTWRLLEGNHKQEFPSSSGTNSVLYSLRRGQDIHNILINSIRDILRYDVYILLSIPLVCDSDTNVEYVLRRLSTY